MTSRAAVVALAVLAALAGCDAPASGGSTPTFTPAPIPESTDAPTAHAGFAPGITASGVDDPGRLAVAHVAALAETSYTVNQTVRRQYANGTLTRRYVTRVRFAADASRFRAVRRQTERRGGALVDRRVERYGDGRRLSEAVTENGTTTYGLVRWPDGRPRPPSSAYPWNLTNGRQIERLFGLVETRPTGRFVRNGTRFVRLETVEPATLRPLENVTLTAVVSERGVVRAYRVRYEFPTDEGRVEALVAVTYDGVGTTTVEPPAWLDRVDARETATG